MGETIGVNVAKRAYDVQVSPQFDGYSAVRIYVGTDDNGDDIIYEAGNTNGRTLEITNAFGTQAMALNILNDIRGYQYQPLSADSALVDPAAEMGDGLTVNGVYTGMYSRSTRFGRLMASDIGAPTDEEIAHEYSTETSATDRAFTRFVKNTKSSIGITATEITAEVERATQAEEDLRASILITAESIQAEISRATQEEGILRASITATAESIQTEVTNRQNADAQLASQITQTADEISANVSRVASTKLDTALTSSSFGWSLTADGFYLNANNNQRIFEANTNGIKISGNAEVTGKITATSGYIGNGSNGFEIRASSITNGKASLYDNYDGIYIGTDGIALGSKFKVDSLGNVTATGLTAENIVLTGSLMIGDSLIDANTLRQGAEYAWDGHNDWDWSHDTVNDGYESWDSTATTVTDNSWYWSDGAANGNAAKNEWDNAHDPYTWVGSIYCTSLITNGFTCYGSVSLDNAYLSGYPMNWISITDKDGNSHFVVGYY